MQTGRADGLSRSPMSRRTGADLGVVYRQLPHSLVSASTTVAVIKALAPRVLVRRRPNEVPNIKTLGGEIDGDNATQVREEVAVDSQLGAVIDFGGCAAGDPAHDLAMAWSFFSGSSRGAFFSALDVDDATRARGRGWPLWKALITLAQGRST